MLGIHRINEPFGFQKPGNYANWRWGLSIAPQNKLLSFHYDVIGGGTLTIFEARKIEIDYIDYKIIETIDLIANKPIESGSMHYELQLLILSSILDCGLYYFYLSDGINERKSEIFCVKQDMIVRIGDFSDDFSDDFY